jgi:serine/threonine protein kinase
MRKNLRIGTIQCNDRDLKLENILLTDDLQVKLIDFGFTRFYDDATLLDTYCGSAAYAAPEIVAGQKYSGPEADIWSLGTFFFDNSGVVLYTIVCGYLPFDSDDEVQTQQQIKEIKYEIPEFLLPGISLCNLETADLIKRIFKRNPEERIKIHELFQHPWIQNSSFVKSNNDLSNDDVDSKLGKSTAEVALAAKLEAAGFDVPRILHSVHSNACDQSSALWNLLLSKSQNYKNNTPVSNIMIRLDSVDQFFQDAQKNSTIAQNPLLHIVSQTYEPNDLSTSDPILNMKNNSTKSGKETQKTRGNPKLTLMIKKKSFADDEGDTPPSMSPLSASFSAMAKLTPRPTSGGFLRPTSIRKKITTDEQVDFLLSPTEEPNSRDAGFRHSAGSALRMSYIMKKKGIVEEDEPTT